ncbi:uncharacterized protein LOC122381243 [Amphibalanus amphitrite]|uniref:uncharacterized protein LOC122381243 n=1 Tax=Amphibalanus amphitrite TaxID=1232801 RepID=UPI001C9162D4|nr:uncharacterized protein LOC122381243 [Amphibalanus amphitrite]
MLRLILLAASAALCAGHYGTYLQSRHFAGIDLSPYWQPRYCAPIRLRYPDISDLTCYYIVQYYVRRPPHLYLPHLGLPHISPKSLVPQRYWVQYLSKLVDLMPPVFYYPKPFYSNLYSHVSKYYPTITDSSLYFDHLALTDTYMCSHLVAPASWSLFRPFYSRHVLSLNFKRHFTRYQYVFPRLPTIVSRLKTYQFIPSKPYFKRASLKSLLIGKTRLSYPHPDLFPEKNLWFPRRTLRGLYKYLSKRKYPWSSWFSRIKTITTPKHIKWGSGYDGLVCQAKYSHLSFLCPAWSHGLLPVLRLRFASYPKDIIYSRKATFQSFLSGFLYQWRPRIRVYSQRLVTKALLAFDSYACSWLGIHFSSRYKFCKPSNLWYPTLYSGCKSYGC